MNDQNSHLSALLQQGMELMNHGKLAEAKQLFTRACEVNPQDAKAWYLLSTVNGRMGDIATADECCRRAIEIQPDYCDAWVNLGNVLYVRGNFSGAISHYDKALQINPNSAMAHSKRAAALTRTGKPLDALASCEQAIILDPENTEAYRNLGYIHMGQGHLEEALSAFQQAVHTAPQSAEPHADLGSLYMEKGDIDKAIFHFRRALEINPRHARALNNLSALSRSPERFPAYCDIYRTVVDNIPDPTEARKSFIESVKYMLPAGFDAWLNGELERCYAIADADFTALALVTAHLLKHKYPVSHLTADDRPPDSSLIETLASDRLFLSFLEKSINIDPDIERLLVKLRRAVLRTHIRNEAPGASPIPKLALALAMQCFNNEYVLTRDDEEERDLCRLQDAIEKRLAAGTSLKANTEFDLLVFCMYAPLHHLQCAKRLTEVPPSFWSKEFQNLIDYTLICFLEEERIKDHIPTLGNIEDQTSKLVRSQYEENPYPRWLSLPELKKTSPGNYLRHLFPFFSAPAFLDGPIKILVAGCGTGQQPIRRALSYDKAHILAVDISKSSLAYAIRMARKYKVTNIEFVQGDILELSALDDRFHIIECMGVLHHMRDPLAGWTVLTELLRPQGLMKIGLYSEKARRRIVAAREAIKNEDLSPTNANIREFRRRILNHEMDEFLNGVTENADFYTTSKCRDLLFHFMEHRFTLPGISQILDDLSLEFLGFEFPADPTSSAAARSYSAQFPEDRQMTNLALWDRFETLYPDTFITMYTFWCQKRG